MIPEFKYFALPVLSYLSDGANHTIADCLPRMKEVFSLSDEEMQELLPSGASTIVKSRTQWSLTYLKHAGLVKSEKRGVYSITEDGRELLKNPPECISQTFLAQNYPSFKNFTIGNKDASSVENVDNGELSPMETLQNAYTTIKEQLKDELLDRVLSLSPKAFEGLVVKLMERMGYGDGSITRFTGDEGIDGIISEDKLGLGKIYLQAKRWNKNSTVGRPDVQGFIGAVSTHGGTKGVFITTGSFSKKAREVPSPSVKLVLIDGGYLTELMIQYDLGVSTTDEYKIKRIDSDFFDMDDMEQ